MPGDLDRCLPPEFDRGHAGDARGVRAGAAAAAGYAGRWRAGQAVRAGVEYFVLPGDSEAGVIVHLASRDILPLHACVNSRAVGQKEIIVKIRSSVAQCGAVCGQVHQS